MSDDIDLKKLALLSSPTGRQQQIIDYLMQNEPVEIRFLEEPSLLEADLSKLEERIFNMAEDREITRTLRGQSKDRLVHETVWPAHKEKISEILSGRTPNLMIIDEWHSLPSGMLYERLDRPEPDVPDWKHPIPPQVKGASPGPSERKRAALRAKRKKRSR